MDGVHRPSSTQLCHQQQLFGLLARVKQWGQVEKLPSSIWATSKDVFMICPRGSFWHVAAWLSTLLVASQRCSCRVLLMMNLMMNLIDCGMAALRRIKSTWCRFGMSHACRFHVPRHFESSKLNLGNSHVSMTFCMRWTRWKSWCQCPTQMAQALECHSLPLWCRTYESREVSPISGCQGTLRWQHGDVEDLSPAPPKSSVHDFTEWNAGACNRSAKSLWYGTNTISISTTEWLDAPKTLLSSGPLLGEFVEVRSVFEYKSHHGALQIFQHHTVFFPKTLEMDYISHYLTPAHPEMATRWCWRSITRSPKKQCARFYRMKCRSLAQKCKESLVWYKHHIHIHHRMAWCT